MTHLLLQRLERLTPLTTVDREALQAQSQRVQLFRAKEDFTLDGEHPRFVNLILEGWACRYKQLEDGRRQIIAFFLPGDMCDPMVCLLGEMCHTLGALTPVRVARVTHEEMRGMMERTPTLERAFWLDMMVNAEIQREWTVSLGRRSAIERMAHIFCEVFTRLSAIGLSDGPICEFPATQADLADALGLSHVHVSRTLQELRHLGLVDLRGKKLKIFNEAALRELAMFNPSYLHLRNPA